MSSLDLLSMAIRNLFKRKLRTSLTVLGVVIGTASIVVMVSLGVGINRSMEERIQNMGDITMINVQNYEGYYGYSKTAPIIDDDFIKLIEQEPGVVVASPTLYMDFKAVCGKFTAYLNVMGIKPEMLQAMGVKIAEGRMLEVDDKDGILFGSDVALYYFYNPSSRRYRWDDSSTPKVNLMKDKITGSFDYSYGEPTYNTGEGDVAVNKPKTFKVTAIGVMERSDDWRTSSYSYMSLDAAVKMNKDKQKYQLQNGGRQQQKTYGYQEAMIKCKDLKDVEKVTARLDELGYTQYYTPSMYIKEFQDMMLSLQLLLGAIGGVAFVVAAIGISNTMVMSIYERTREIGVMKVIGAALADIGKLFLVEAALIGLLGGIFGLGLSYVVSYVINSIGISILEALTGSGTAASYIPIWLAGGALAFSAAIGLLSGFFPALRAMRLSALSAIRTE